MSTQPKAYITEEQYLEIEERSEQPSEYFRGEMFPMEATIAHVMIKDNLLLVLARELTGSDCRAFSNELRIKVSETGLYTYPDVAIVCGKLQVAENDKNSVTNPKILIEVLSPTGEGYTKFLYYRSNPTFVEYLLIAQDRVRLEHYIKQSDGGWLMHETSDPDALISLESIPVRFKLSEAYRGVEF